MRIQAYLLTKISQQTEKLPPYATQKKKGGIRICYIKSLRTVFVKSFTESLLYCIKLSKSISAFYLAVLKNNTVSQINRAIVGFPSLFCSIEIRNENQKIKKPLNSLFLLP